MGGGRMYVMDGRRSAMSGERWYLKPKGSRHKHCRGI